MRGLDKARTVSEQTKQRWMPEVMTGAMMTESSQSQPRGHRGSLDRRDLNRPAHDTDGGMGRS